MRALEVSAPERVALVLALTLLALHAVAPADALEYRRVALSSEPWRVLTGHLVHINWPHALINAAALWVVARLYAPDLGPWRQAIALALSAARDQRRARMAAAVDRVVQGPVWRPARPVLRRGGEVAAGGTAAYPAAAVAAGGPLCWRLDQGGAGTARRRRHAAVRLAGRGGRPAGAPGRRALRNLDGSAICGDGCAPPAPARRAVATVRTAERHRRRRRQPEAAHRPKPRSASRNCSSRFRSRW